jgi:hypothetical protein
MQYSIFSFEWNCFFRVRVTNVALQILKQKWGQSETKQYLRIQGVEADQAGGERESLLADAKRWGFPHLKVLLLNLTRGLWRISVWIFCLLEFSKMAVWKVSYF